MSKGMNNLIRMNQVAQRKQRRIIHQKDWTGKSIIDTWILDGVGKREGKPLADAGWKWTPGPDGGAWTTQDQNQGRLAIESAERNNIPVSCIGNGWLDNDDLDKLLDLIDLI